jgi:hypothetical protein
VSKLFKFLNVCEKVYKPCYRKTRGSIKETIEMETLEEKDEDFEDAGCILVFEAKIRDMYCHFDERSNTQHLSGNSHVQYWEGSNNYCSSVLNAGGV